MVSGRRDSRHHHLLEVTSETTTSIHTTPCGWCWCTESVFRQLAPRILNSFHTSLTPNQEQLYTLLCNDETTRNMLVNVPFECLQVPVPVINHGTFMYCTYTSMCIYIYIHMYIHIYIYIYQLLTGACWGVVVALRASYVVRPICKLRISKFGV